MSDQMLITAVLPYFGGKRTLAPRIVQELGPHSAYWEPFCGSLAVLLAKPAASMETVNDLLGDVVNLARVLADEAAAMNLYTRLQHTLMTEDTFNDAAEAMRARGWTDAGPVADVDRAYDFFLTAWLGRNGVTGTPSFNQGFCVRYTSTGGNGARRFVSAVDSIPAWHQRLRSVVILNRNAREIIARVDDAPGTVLYLDPPYVDKGASYIHDFAPPTPIKAARSSSKASVQHSEPLMTHAELAAMCRRFTKTRVVISYYDHPLVRELYDGWTFIAAPTAKAMVNAGTRKRARDGAAQQAPEVLIVNGGSFTGGST